MPVSAELPPIDTPPLPEIAPVTFIVRPEFAPKAAVELAVIAPESVMVPVAVAVTPTRSLPNAVLNTMALASVPSSPEYQTGCRLYPCWSCRW